MATVRLTALHRRSQCWWQALVRELYREHAVHDVRRPAREARARSYSPTAAVLDSSTYSMTVGQPEAPQMVQARQREHPAQAESLRGRVDADDVHLADRAVRRAPWSSGSRPARRRARRGRSPSAENHGSRSRRSRSARVHRPCSGWSAKARRVDAHPRRPRPAPTSNVRSRTPGRHGDLRERLGERAAHLPQRAEPLEAELARRGRRRRGQLAVRPDVQHARPASAVPGERAAVAAAPERRTDDQLARVAVEDSRPRRACRRRRRARHRRRRAAAAAGSRRSAVRRRLARPPR